MMTRNASMVLASKIGSHKSFWGKGRTIVQIRTTILDSDIPAQFVAECVRVAIAASGRK